MRASRRYDLVTTRLYLLELAVQNRELECGGAHFPGGLRQAIDRSHPESQAPRSQMLGARCARSVLARGFGFGQEKNIQSALLGSFRGSPG
jgi:hypothetical protein